MGLIKWIKRELDSSNTCKRRESEPPLSTNSSQRPPDESYVKALSKFNEWRQRQVFRGSARLSRKQSRKLNQRRMLPDEFSDNPIPIDCKEILPKDSTPQDSNSYEEILVDHSQYHLRKPISVPIGNVLDIVPIRHSFPATEVFRTKSYRNHSIRQATDGLEIYENTNVDIVNNFDGSPDILNISKHLISPPTKFFRESSHPFTDAQTPIQEQKSSQELLYEHPRDLERLGAVRFTSRLSEEHCESNSSGNKSSKSHPYQTVINKHGEEVEYALPLNEKLSDQENSSERFEEKEIITCNSARIQEYVDENFQFLDKTNSPGTSSMSISFDPNQFYNRTNVPVTDLDKTSGTRNTEEQSLCKQTDIIRELESLENWSRALSKDLISKPVNGTNNNMNPLQHFVEIIVCNTNEIIESNPRKILETCSGTLRRGTFYNVPVTRFKPHRREPLYDDSALQLNYEVMSKIRHPNLALIMGIAVDNKCAVDSLILEPLTCSLHSYIHKQENSLPLLTCLQFTIQINDAVTFLHINGLVHSNISSHSILMCHSFQIVKLTSFELTTSSNEEAKNELVNVTENENTRSKSAINIPYKYRPYFVNYRKIFSKHNYQAPELLSTNPFVFPKEQSDVYGICLTLWEMVNCSIPFFELDYDEMLKLVRLQNLRLMAQKHDRQKPFDKIFAEGLPLNPETRLPNTIELKALLDGISLGTENKVYLPHEKKINSVENNLECVPNLLLYSDTYERSSTLKVQSNDYNVVPFISPTHRQQGEIAAPTHRSPSNAQTLHYGIEIGEVSIPKTPTTCKNNKVDLPNEKKVNSVENNLECLSNLFIDSDTNQCPNNIKVHNNDYNFLSSISHTNRRTENHEIATPVHTSSPNVPSLQYGFEIGDVYIPETPIARSNKLRKNAWLSNQSISPIVHSGDLPKYNDENKNAQIKASKQMQESPSRKVYNVNIRIRPSTTRQQFPPIDENTARSVEDNNSSMQHVNRSSQIYDHINFFNSIIQSSPQIGIPPHPKSSSSTDSVNFNKSITKPLVPTEKIVKSSSTNPIDQECINEFFSRSQSSADFENSLWRREKQKCDQSVKSQRRISVKDAVDKFESFSKLNETYTPKPKKSTAVTTPSQSSKIFSPSISNSTSDYVDSPEKSVSRLSVVLRKKNSSKPQTEEAVSIERRTSEMISHASDLNQTPIVTLNFKKLDRRASDVGTNLFKKNTKTRAITARHSIYGTQIFQRLSRAKNSYEDGPSSFQGKDKNFKIKVGKLMCLNCGHKLFVVDDVVSSGKGEDVHEGCTEILFTPLTRNLALQQFTKSTEDFYIDDDFRDEECVNMELGTRSQLSDLIDIDILSAQIFNPTEELTLQNNLP